MVDEEDYFLDVLLMKILREVKELREEVEAAMLSEEEGVDDEGWENWWRKSGEYCVKFGWMFDVKSVILIDDSYGSGDDDGEDEAMGDEDALSWCGGVFDEDDDDEGYINEVDG